MKVLLHSHFPAGHCLPMQAIAHALTTRGHIVRWLTSPSSSHHVARTSAVHIPTSALDQLDAPLAAQSATGLLDGDYSRLENRVLAQVEDYRRALSDFEADVLLVDVWPHGARALWELGEGPVWASLGVIPMYTSNWDGPFAVSGEGPPRGWIEWLVNGLRQLARQWVVFPLMLEPIIDRQRMSLGLPALKFGEPADSFWYSPNLHIQASSSTLEFQQKPQAVDRVEFVGPLVMPAKTSTDELPEWWPRVISHNQVIGITQGTLAMDPASLIVPSIQALADDANRLLVVASPHAKEIEARLGSSENVLFATWLPYHVLLPQLSLLITNGGYGSITQALSHKVPLLCAGQTEDKKDTAARVAWAGAGIDLKTDNPSAEQVLQAALRILDDASYRVNAATLGDELNAQGGAQRACDLLEELVEAQRPRL